ncbi:hypothetical protein J8J27_21835, partial [Mycobacterium tuberculosis]|nr:hypothetical protein [Mycobacterium tuberculosis]
MPLTAAWLGAAVAGLIALRAMYDHYGHALLPALTLVSGVTVWHGLQVSGQGRAILVRAALFVTVLTAPFTLTPRSLFAGRVDMVALGKVSAAVAEQERRSGDTLIAANRGVPIYLLTGLMPAETYVHPNHLLCDFPLPDKDPLGMTLA